MIIPNICKNKKCPKPPTRLSIFQPQDIHVSVPRFNSTAPRESDTASGELLDHGLNQAFLVQGLHRDAHVFQLLAAPPRLTSRSSRAGRWTFPCHEVLLGFYGVVGNVDKYAIDDAWKFIIPNTSFSVTHCNTRYLPINRNQPGHFSWRHYGPTNRCIDHLYQTEYVANFQEKSERPGGHHQIIVDEHPIVN